MKTAVWTVGQIADQLGQPPSRVAYLIAKHRLKPIGRVGIIRLFSQQQTEVLRESMHELHRRKNQKGVSQ